MKYTFFGSNGRYLRILRQHKLLSFVVLVAVIAGLLDVAGQDTIAHWILGATSFIALLPSLKEMYEDIRHGTYGINIIGVTAIVTAILLHQYWAAILLISLLLAGELLEDYASKRVHTELGEIQKREPRHAHVMRGRKVLDVSAADVHIGDKIVILPGELVPVDCVLLEGSANFDESHLAGKAFSLNTDENMTILSGSLNLGDSVTARAIETAAHSQYRQIVRVLRNATKSKGSFVRLAERFNIPFTVMALAIAAAAWVVGGESVRFLQVIVAASSAPLLLAPPLAITAGMSRASRYGIMFKSSSALEQLADAQTLAFGKSGTLTAGLPKVDKITTFAGFRQPELLGFAASLEANSKHELAAVIVEAARKKKASFSQAKHVVDLPSQGLRAHVKGRDVLVGRLSLMESNDVLMPAAFKPNTVQQTAVYVAIDNQLAGVITFTDTLRPDLAVTFARLRKMGISRVLMLTGGTDSAAKKLAKKLGIQDYQAEALPVDKLLAVERAADKPVVFVGNGVNDAPVLTAADVGIALNARGANAAAESADILIMQNDFDYTARAIALAKQTLKIARRSILIGMGLSLVLMLLFTTGKFTPVVGVLAQAVILLFVLFSALRAHSPSEKIFV